MSKPVKIVVCGLGNVGKAFMELISERGKSSPVGAAAALLKDLINAF
jgi:homoserine dehydrogenase